MCFSCTGTCGIHLSHSSAHTSRIVAGQMMKRGQPCRHTAAPSACTDLPRPISSAMSALPPREHTNSMPWSWYADRRRRISGGSLLHISPVDSVSALTPASRALTTASRARPNARSV